MPEFHRLALHLSSQLPESTLLNIFDLLVLIVANGIYCVNVRICHLVDCFKRSEQKLLNWLEIRKIEFSRSNAML